MGQYNQELFGGDLSEDCLILAKKVQQIAKTFSAKLALIHIIEPIPAYGYPGFEGLQSPLIESAKEQFKQVAKELGVEQNSCFLEFGSVRSQISKIQDEIRADLVIIGSHHRHGLSRLLSSDAHGIIHHVNCDVLLIYSDEIL